MQCKSIRCATYVFAHSSPPACYGGPSWHLVYFWENKVKTTPIFFRAHNDPCSGYRLDSVRFYYRYGYCHRGNYGPPGERLCDNTKGRLRPSISNFKNSLGLFSKKPLHKYLLAHLTVCFMTLEKNKVISPAVLTP